MAYFVILGGLIGSFTHLVLKDGIVKEGEIGNLKNWYVAFFAGIVAYGAYLAFVNIGFLPAASGIVPEIGLGAFVGYSLDSIAKKKLHWKK
jgi:hypothetical protein